MSSSETRDGESDHSRAAILLDDSAVQFRASHPDDQFSGTSGMLFEQAMAQTRMAICLTDPHQPDNPIVFANRAFRELTGYSQEEIIGRNCRFLQGAGTDPEPVGQLRRAIAGEDVVIVEMLNYRKGGRPFWNALHVGPIYDDAGRLVYFFGSQWDVSDLHSARMSEQHARLVARELSHRMKNMFSVITAIVNVTGRVRGIDDEALEISTRIQALGRAYETTLDDAGSGTSELQAAIQATLAPYADRIGMDGENARVSFTVISTLSLVLQELAANATKYGAWSQGEGHIGLSWTVSGEVLTLVWRESGGPAVVASPRAPGTGTVIVDRLLRVAGGTIAREWHTQGLEVRVTLPASGGQM